MKGLATILLLLCSQLAWTQHVVNKDTLLMGSAFRFTAIHPNADSAWYAINAGIAEVVRIEKLISSWDPNSETTKINQAAGQHAVPVSLELYNLIFRSKKVSQLSDGYFDISFASIDKIWDFSKGELALSELPGDEAIAESIAKINYQNIELKEGTLSVFLSQQGMKIGFGAIGKGYAANRAKAIMQQFGATSGVVNAGGDLISWGTKLDGSPWTIGIADPKDKTNILAWLDVSDIAVVTSGNYEHYLTIDGERYCHIINPKTGWPVKGLQSVTVVCPDAEVADALATTVFVMGEEKGLELLNQLEGIDCIIVNDEGEMLSSDNIDLNLISSE